MSTSIETVLSALALLGLAACSSEAAPGTGQNTGGTPTAGGGGSAAVSGGAPSGGSASGAGGAATTAGMGGNPGSAGGGSGGLASGGESAGGTSGGNAGTAGNAGGGTGGASGSGGGGAGNRPTRVLLYSFSTLNIASVPQQIMLLKQKLESWQYQVDDSKDPAVFSDANLAKYAAVGMINTCFAPFGANQSGEAESQALQRFLQQGGGLFGTHCADVTFQSAAQPVLYNRLIGGRAASGDFYNGQSACRKMGDHPTSASLPATFSYTGDLDNTDFLATDSMVLVRCTWGPPSNKDVAVSWVRNEGSGRVFFTSFAKEDTDLTNTTIGDNHIFAGLAWVLGRPSTLARLEPSKQK